MPPMFADAELWGAVSAAFGTGAPLVWLFGKKLFGKLSSILSRFDAIIVKVKTVSDKVDRVEDKVDSVSERVKRIEPIAEVVQKEFSPNGGKSLRDAINRAERRAAMIEGILRARFEGDSEATYECGPDGKCTSASTALADLFGMSPESLLGTGWLKAIKSQKERVRVWHNWLVAIKEGVPYKDVYEILVDGKTLKVQTYTRVVPDDDGKPLCYFGLVTPAPDSKLSGKTTKSDPTLPRPPDPDDNPPT